jgi:hypothetical protein
LRAIDASERFERITQMRGPIPEVGSQGHECFGHLCHENPLEESLASSMVEEDRKRNENRNRIRPLRDCECERTPLGCVVDPPSNAATARGARAEA